MTNKHYNDVMITGSNPEQAKQVSMSSVKVISW